MSTGDGARPLPRIGIPIPLETRDGQPYQAVSGAYAAAVAAAGGLPFYLPVQSDAAALIAQVDGLLIPGGNDFLPAQPYPPAVHFDPVEPAQLAFDRSLLERALEAGRPVLGICYGMQLLAVTCGGRLHYDIPSDVPGALAHQRPPSERHAIALEPGSRLAALLGPGLETVNTSHHQAVADPGQRLRVSARAPDGVVEAIETADGGFCVGVQWHPERSNTVAERRLLRAFVDACRC